MEFVCLGEGEQSREDTNDCGGGGSHGQRFHQSSGGTVSLKVSVLVPLVSARFVSSAGHRIVDLLLGGKVVCVLRVACGSCGGRVVGGSQRQAFLVAHLTMQMRNKTPTKTTQSSIRNVRQVFWSTSGRPTQKSSTACVWIILCSLARSWRVGAASRFDH